MLSVQEVVRDLSRVEAEYKKLYTSCPWGREEVEDVQFFREYITKGNKSFMSAFNGYRRLKPLAHKIYENPTSPSIKVGNCVKGFVLSAIKIAWSEYLADIKKKEESSEPIDMLRSIQARKIEEAIDLRREEEENLKKVLEVVGDRKNRQLNYLFEKMVAMVLVKRLLEKVRELALSKDQDEAYKKLLETAEESLSEEVKKFVEAARQRVGEEVRKEVKFLNDKRPDFKRYESEILFLAREYIKKNGLENRVISETISELRRVSNQMGGRSRETAKDIISSLEKSLSGKEVVDRESVIKNSSDAEAISLARRMFSYLKNLEEIKRNLEQVKAKIEKYEKQLEEMKNRQGLGSRKTEQGSKSGNARDKDSGNKGANSEKEKKTSSLQFPQRQKERFENLFRDIVEEIEVVLELLKFLTKEGNKAGILGRALSAAGAIGRGVRSVIDGIADSIGLRRQWGVEHVLAVASEIGLQVF